MEAPRKKSAIGLKLNPSPSYCFITNLPSPILMDILCRVPIQTLVASKSVCRSWLHLITDPQFPQLRQSKAPTEVCFQQFYDDDTIKLHMGNFNYLSNFDFDVKLNRTFEIPKFSVGPNNALNYKATRGTFHFANSCNGLLCFYDCYSMFALIWNPCTSEFITFPAPKTRGRDERWTICYGLGFSRKVNKFKLLRVFGRDKTWYSAGVAEAVADICTIEKQCSWKTVGPCSSAVWKPVWGKDTLYGTFLQGTLHWVGSSDSNKYDVTIHAFDFEEDQFGRIPLPPSYVKNSRNVGSLAQETLGVLAGCLLVTDYTDQGVSIWLMKEYGVQDSWTELFSLGSTIDKGLHYDRCLPIAYMNNGEILMTCTYSLSTTVFSYNPVLKSVRVMGSGPGSLRVIAYRPSLVLVKDSMLGYDHVHVMKPRCADLKQGDPDWWKPVKEKPPQHGSEVLQFTRGPRVRAAGSKRAGRMA